MAETITTNYSWTKPDPGASANTWGSTPNDDLDKIDAQVFANQQGLSPIGAITMYAGATAPTNWLLCNGATLSQAAPYDKLFAILGAAFNVGTVAADKFMLPNLQTRFPVGALNNVGATGGAATVTLDTTMIPAHQHGVGDPGHTHTITQTAHTHTDAGHTHPASQTAHDHGGVTVPGGTFSLGASGYTTQAGRTDMQQPTVTVTAGAAVISSNNANVSINSNVTGIAALTSSVGGGLPHTNLPPWLALNFIVRYQ